MQYRRIDLSSNIFSPGSLLGTSLSQQAINDINSTNYGHVYFGSIDDPFRASYNSFMTNVVDQLNTVTNEINAVGAAISKPDIFRAITSVDDLIEGVPPCMYQAILTHEPIRVLANNELIDAFGVPKDQIELTDTFGNLITNGRCEFVPGISTDNEMESVYEVFSCDSDIDMDIKEEVVSMVEDTRDFLDFFLKDPKTRNLDPTSVPPLDLRG